MRYFVTPVTRRVTLEDGAWIDIKERLTHGERESMFATMSPYVTPGEPIQVARKEIRTALVSTYLVAWSLTREDGTAVPMAPDLPENVRLATIRSLSADGFDEIHRAIDGVVDAVRVADDLEKNGSARVSAS